MAFLVSQIVVELLSIGRFEPGGISGVWALGSWSPEMLYPLWILACVMTEISTMQWENSETFGLYPANQAALDPASSSVWSRVS
jgi:hypothetical protein